jgi:hypothetical protein
MLENEIGDVLAMVDILIERNILTQENLNIAKQRKKEKLKQWSSIYDSN